MDKELAKIVEQILLDEGLEPLESLDKELATKGTESMVMLWPPLNTNNIHPYELAEQKKNMATSINALARNTGTLLFGINTGEYGLFGISTQFLSTNGKFKWLYNIPQSRGFNPTRTTVTTRQAERGRPKRDINSKVFTLDTSKIKVAFRLPAFSKEAFIIVPDKVTGFDKATDAHWLFLMAADEAQTLNRTHYFNAYQEMVYRVSKPGTL